MVDLRLGDCRDVMRTLDAESVDSIVTDPPYGLSFMGKGWDHGVPGVEFWVEALRVAKPGAHLLAFGGTRTFHRLAVAIEDAGWEIRDCVMWVYGSGFPKSLDVSKAIGKAAGAKREVVGRGKKNGGASNGKNSASVGYVCETNEYDITAPATDAARQWQGWGTALKPAWEPVIVARKPLVGTVAENVLRYGTGGINVDGCRVQADDLESLQKNWDRVQSVHQGIASTGLKSINLSDRAPSGRWPANVIHDGSDEVVGLFPNARSSCGGGKSQKADIGYAGGWKATYDNSDGQYYDSGSAARFFYCAKASKADRDEGCEGFSVREAGSRHAFSGLPDQRMDREQERHGARNHHPTVKPTDLMRYLCRLVTPPNGVILDPFMGSGSTGKAAILEHYRFIGIDLDPEYHQIATARIQHAQAQTAPLFTTVLP